MVCRSANVKAIVLMSARNEMRDSARGMRENAEPRPESSMRKSGHAARRTPGSNVRARYGARSCGSAGLRTMVTFLCGDRDIFPVLIADELTKAPARRRVEFSHWQLIPRGAANRKACSKERTLRSDDGSPGTWKVPRRGGGRGVTLDCGSRLPLCRAAACCGE